MNVVFPEEKHCIFEAPWSPAVLQGISARNMMLLGQAIALAAGERKESRGAHYRSDYPDRDDSRFKTNIVVAMDDDGKLTSRLENANAAKGSFNWNRMK